MCYQPLSLYKVATALADVTRENYSSMQKYEDITTRFSATHPLQGILSGLVRIGVGFHQTLIWGLFYGAVGTCKSYSSKKSTAEKGQEECSRSWVHLKNGAGNIVAGIVDGIPLISSIVFIFRGIFRGNTLISYPLKNTQPYHHFPLNQMSANAVYLAEVTSNRIKNCLSK